MKQLSINEKYIFTKEMETILSSGLSIDEGLSMIEENALEADVKEVAKQCKTLFYQEGNFSKAIEKVGAFDQYMIKLVEIGEINGHLDTVMQELSFYYEREEQMNLRMKEATTYPFVLLVTMTIIVGILVFKVLPIFEKVMDDMGASMHSTSRVMMHFGQGFALVAFVILIVIFLGIVLFKVLAKDQEKKDAFLSRFFLTKKLVDTMALAKLTYALSLFISSGYPLEETIQYLPSFITHKPLKEKMEAVNQKMQKENCSFMDALSQAQVYSGSTLSYLSIGLRSGKQEEVLKKLVDLYENQVDESTSKFINIIEPTIVTICSLIVGIILLSIMLPLMGIMSSIS